MGSRHLITKKMKISKISLVLLMLMIHFTEQQITFNLSTFNVVTLASGIGVLAFLGYAAGKSLKRGRFPIGLSQSPYSQLLLQQPRHQPLHQPQHQLQPQHVSVGRQAGSESPTGMRGERKRKEFLIHKGDTEVGRGWFYMENRR